MGKFTISLQLNSFEPCNTFAQNYFVSWVLNVWPWLKSRLANQWCWERHLMETCTLDLLPMLLNILALPPKFNLYLVDHLWLESLHCEGTFSVLSIYRVSQKKCPIATCSLNLFQRSDYTFSHVLRNQNFEPVPSKHFKHTHSEY